MHRFYLPPDQCHDPILTLRDAEAHHALHVLRLRRGERVTVLDGAGRQYLCEAAEPSRTAVQLVVQETRSIPPPSCQFTLAQGIPKGKMLDAIIQKATELGVWRIVPLLSERVVLHLDEEKSATKTEHWGTIAIEAIKQCGSAWLPRVDPPLAFRAFLARREQFDLSLIATLQPDSQHPRAWLRAFREAHQQMPRSVCLWIGPEGDFTPDEIAAAQSAGVHPITLGPLVLRSETAAVYGLSVLHYELQAPTV